MKNAVFLAPHGEHVGDVSGGGSFGIARREAELDAVVGEHRVDAIRHGGDEGFEEGGGSETRGTVGKLDEGTL